MNAESLTSNLCSDSLTIIFILHCIAWSNFSLIISGMRGKELRRGNTSTTMQIVHLKKKKNQLYGWEKLFS